MSIRAYIKQGAHIKIKAQNHKGNVTYHYEAFNEVVFNAEDDPNIGISERLHLAEKIPVELENAVRYWSMHERIIAEQDYVNRRAVGKYRLGRAKAEVENSSSGPNQNIKVHGPDLKECAELKDMILAGTIPVSVPYSVPQVTSRVLRVREALHQLIESVAVAFDGFRLR